MRGLSCTPSGSLPVPAGAAGVLSGVPVLPLLLPRVAPPPLSRGPGGLVLLLARRVLGPAAVPRPSG